MADINVNPNNLRTASNQLKKISSSVDLCASEVKRIRKSMKISNNVDASLKKNLLTISNTLDNKKHAINSAGNALNSIVSLYSNSEKNIANKAVKKSKNNSKASINPIFMPLLAINGSQFATLGIEWWKKNQGDVEKYYDYFDKNLNKVPKSIRDIVGLYMKRKGIGKVSDVYKVLKDLRKSDWGMAFADAGKKFAGKSVNENGNINWKVLKIKAALDTIGLVTKKGGYIEKNKAKYEDFQLQSAFKGDLYGIVSGISAEFVQTVGKGSVDVLCKTVYGAMDSAFEAATLGHLNLTTIDDMTYDALGMSFGRGFNATTQFVSDVVDVVCDKGIIGLGSAAFKKMSDASSAINNTLLEKTLKYIN